LDTARERFSTALERDYFMTAQEAIEFGIVDKIVEKRADADVSAAST
jgi:ATP-dependent Clp protease protease subunit